MENWVEQNNRLEKTYIFKNFTDAITWMMKASFLIEKMDHHPEWTNIYNKVKVVLCTHSAGNVITEKDRVLAKELDVLYS